MRLLRTEGHNGHKDRATSWLCLELGCWQANQLWFFAIFAAFCSIQQAFLCAWRNNTADVLFDALLDTNEQRSIGGKGS